MYTLSKLLFEGKTKSEGKCCSINLTNGHMKIPIEGKKNNEAIIVNAKGEIMLDDGKDTTSVNIISLE